MKTLLLIDANSLIHRTFHALPPLTNKKGEPTGSLYGLSSILITITQRHHPDYVAALFDRPEPTFRKELFNEYKAHRPKADKELIDQIIAAHETFAAFSIPTVEQPGFEADDLIGTLAHQYKNTMSVTILTGDLDSLQLVDDDSVVVETFKKGISETITYNEQGVFDKWGVWPHQVIDFKALVGDTSDNIPGVPGVGPKTASAILQQYDSLEIFFERGSDHPKYAHIIHHKEQALLSKTLATINTSVPLSIQLSDMQFRPAINTIQTYCEQQDFSTLIKRLGGMPSSQKKSPVKKPTTDNINNVCVIGPDTDGSTCPPHTTKIGFDLKDIYKQNPFDPPYIDLGLGFTLLEKGKKTWQLLCESTLNDGTDYTHCAQTLWPILSEEIQQNNLGHILYDIEMPLIPVLAEMEQRGILIDKQQLSTTQQQLSKELKQKEGSLLKQIQQPININSPKQLLEYFNDTVGVALTSTAAEQLQEIATDYPIVNEILAYRELFKLKTTYVDSFERLTEPDNRIHPTFLQLGAATGRLSCQNPNLQNIPQESSWAPAIRNCIVAPQNFQLVSMDYSQIELRILASLSKDPNMIDAFNNNKDIHTITAHKVFGVPLDSVDSHQRRTAKALNFGILYGMGPRAFAKQSGITQKEAKEFIAKYFQEFSQVKQWQQTIIEQARSTGYVENIHGRKRMVPSLISSNQRYASEAERITLNMPLQGTAADIIKTSMITIHNLIKKNSLENDVYMVMTIHDELVFEIRESAIEVATPLIKEAMESAIELLVPLTVETKQGGRWGEMKKISNQ